LLPATVRLAQRHIDHRLRLAHDRREMRFAVEALRVDLVNVLGARRPRGKPAAFVVTLSPPIAAPLPGALVSFASIGSPASVAAAIDAGESFASRAFCSGVAAASIRV
jgi:hypothetical protein